MSELPVLVTCHVFLTSDLSFCVEIQSLVPRLFLRCETFAPWIPGQSCRHPAEAFPAAGWSSTRRCGGMKENWRLAQRLEPNEDWHDISTKQAEDEQQGDARLVGARLSRGVSGRGACYMYEGKATGNGNRGYWG